ncbi:helix-turn-helix domain-containing protein [Gordonia sp. OPL2]|uniref:helix-turn-helix domain-containing protein n=1 Tax=Gordonia sp. OPL2 TaxID=2486274 RepID=UPI0016552E42|nr:helix-turn-helix transcriptional regulator [Gordonia sp. OPL2]ROZ88970.1 XRE family transcriptional regulator [Gordonia sp. OPL2]
MNFSPGQRLASRVRELMKGSGITQNQAATALHMSQSAFSRRYLGRVELRASEIQILAELLDVTVADLIEDQPSPSTVDDAAAVGGVA